MGCAETELTQVKSSAPATIAAIVGLSKPDLQYQFGFIPIRYYLECPHCPGTLALAATLHDPRYRALITLLTEARIDAGLSQDALARRLDRPQSFVGKIETLQRRVDALELFDIIEALELDPSEFAGVAASRIGAKKRRQRRSS